MPPSASHSAPTPAGDDRNLVPVDETYIAPTFEERLSIFWRKNSKLITGLLVLIVVVIAVKGAWEYLQAKKEREIGQAYVAATTPAQVKAFAAEHPQHPLGGVAHLRVADEAYSEGRYAEAIPAYEQAASILQTGPLASRARLGLAMTKLQSGSSADAEAALKAFAADANEVSSYRAEATYHLASLAAAAGNAADVKAYSDQLMQLDPTSPWTQRGLSLRGNAAVEETPPATDSPSITLPGTSK